MKKYLYTVVVLLITATQLHAQNKLTNELHGGVWPTLRGHYNHKFEKFKQDIVMALNDRETGKIFQDPNFLDRFLLNAQIETGKNIDLQYVLDNSYTAPLPAGFRKSREATHEMSVWTVDAREIAFWEARDPEVKDEMGIWLDGKCIASLYCINLIREVRRQDMVIRDEDPSKYVKPKIASYQVPAGSTVNVYTGVYNSGNSTNTNTQSAPQAAPAVTEELGGSNLTVRRRNVVREEIIDDGYYQPQQPQRRRLVETFGGQVLANGLGTAGGILLVRGIDRLFGGGNNNNCSVGYYQQPQPQPYCYTPRQPRNPYVSQYGPGFQGVYNDVPQIRYTNNPYGAPRQGALTPAQRSASSNYSTNRQEICGNGIDDDGDGLVDEGCSSGGFGWN